MPKINTRFALSGATLFILAALAIASHAQESQSPAPAADADQTGEPLKVNVNVVQLFFNVKDKKGGLIPGLTKDQFQVFEDGKQQTIKYFAADSNLPLTLGILFDTSPSQTRVLDMEKLVGGQFLDEILRDKDLAFVMGFDADVDLLQDFTNSTRLLKKAMNQAKIGGGGGFTGPGGGPVPTLSHGCCTMLYDAVYLAAHDELAQQVGRKAMILLTDGEDEGSKLKLPDAIEAAQKSDAICYVLLIADRGGAWMGFGAGEMNKLAKETGGRVIEVGNKFEKLKEGFDQIAKELRSQYNLGYTPTNSNLDGTFRKIEIRTNDKDMKVQSRAGYYAIAKEE
jgi:VWFA-related protein